MQTFLVARQRESPAQYREYQQGIQDMDEQIENVIAPHLEFTDRIIQGKRQRYDRPPRNRRLIRRGKRIPYRPELPDVGVVADGIEVIEDEGRAVGVRVGTQAQDRNEQRNDIRRIRKPIMLLCLRCAPRHGLSIATNFETEEKLLTGLPF
ncbi:MAG: hypothetical protein HYU27_06295 [Acidobacteria bacterium]|nr:hypothetical protein [Acidobacteriota bacterium]